MICGKTERGQYIIATPTKCGMTTLKELARRHAGQHISDADRLLIDTSRLGRQAPPIANFRQANWEEPSRDHRMSIPLDGQEGWGTADRWMLVRNPFARWVSVYEYLRLGRNYSQWMARAVQGSAWPKNDTHYNPWSECDPMDYGEFLDMIVSKRLEFFSNRMIKRRGFYTDARAYRSPWIWTDTLWESYHYLKDQPTLGTLSPRDSDRWWRGEIQFLHIERIWEDLELLVERYGLYSPPLSLRRSIHANRTTYRHLDGHPVKADKGDSDYWRAYYGPRFGLCTPDGEWKCAAASGAAGAGPEDECAVCRLAMHAEAAVLGYVKGVLQP